jgi:hypothetical protein
MSAKEDFVMAIKEGFGERIELQETRPNIEVWPEEDDFGKWVASHEHKVRTVLCGTTEFKDTPFCGRGYH